MGMVLTSEDPHANQMGPVPHVVNIANISKGKPGEAVLVGDSSADGGDRQKDGPAEDPDRNKNLDHHAQVPHEEVRVEAIVPNDLAKVGIHESHRPEERGEEVAEAFLVEYALWPWREW